ncbi:MAG: hemerythrin domain-containing protein [Archangium sp.]|nr:hemerythrin domain-containing protein [Archangium sp.]
MKPIDLRELLLLDHRRLEQLSVKLQDAFDANAREDTQLLWTELERSVEAHFRVEERLLFPRFGNIDATETRALAAEHRLLREQLAELGVGVDLKLVRADVARGFLAMLQAHAAREDGLLYRWANEALAEEAGEVADALAPSPSPTPALSLHAQPARGTTSAHPR